MYVGNGMAVYKGLRAIAHRMGKKDGQTILHWEKRLGFPLFVNPSLIMQGWVRYWTDDDSIKLWERSLAATRTHKQGKPTDLAVRCPLCGHQPEKEVTPT